MDLYHHRWTTMIVAVQQIGRSCQMTLIESVALEVDDPTAAEAFYAEAFNLGTRVDLRTSQAPTTGFRGFTLSLVVSQPATVDELIGSAVDAGATPLKPAKRSFWG